MKNDTAAPITAPTKAQIILRLQEIWQTWFSRAYSVGSNTRPIDPEQCLDEALLKGASVVPLAGDRIVYGFNGKVMGKLK